MRPKGNEMSEYENLMRASFRSVYDSVHELVHDEEVSAVVAQWLVLEAYRSGEAGPAAC